MRRATLQRATLQRATLCAAAVLAVAATATGQVWSPRQAALATPWAEEVSVDQPWPEYPRPQLVREGWTNLNGLWDYAIRPRGDDAPEEYDGKIRVPFAVESALSGVMRRVGADNRLWYRRTIEATAGRNGQRLLLHFGAVDWRTQIWIDGQLVGEHAGGYDPFTIEVTEALAAPGEHELVVGVWDPTDAHWQPRGKQVNDPGGIWYTPVTGIWQTVWLEPVPASHLAALHVATDLETGAATFAAEIDGPTNGLQLRLSLAGDQTIVGDATQSLAVAWADGPIAEEDRWTPDRPTLHEYTAELVNDAGVVVDRVESYFAFRSIALGRDDDGVLRLLLNGAPLFQYGPLDQGWWPDGLYTAPTDEALKYDIEMTKRLGFNMIRKHVKVEPARWYAWCDRLGMLVWQDMPNGDRHAPWNPVGGHDGEEIERSAESMANFYAEWGAIMDALGEHPSIVAWVPYNEAWGQADTVAVSEWTKQRDPTRLVNPASGGNDFPVGDLYDIHRYPGPAAPTPDGRRAIVLGEYGGLGLPLEGHTWLERGNWGYRSFENAESLTAAYVDLIDQLHPLIGEPGLAAAIYTQTTDVEVEVNGLLTYDRKVIKMPVDAVAAANRRLYEPPPRFETIAPTSEEAAVEWRYTTDAPSEDWANADFDDSSWRRGPGGFGRADTPGAVVRTAWEGEAIWLRREVELPRPEGRLLLRIHHDEDVEVYLNGVLAARLSGYTTGYRQAAVSDEAVAAMRSGLNTIAVHCRQTTGGQYIDVGFVQIVAR